MLESILYTEVQSLSWFQRLNFKYISRNGLMLLKSIAELPDKTESTKTSSKRKSHDGEKYLFNEEWKVKLNQLQTWKTFHQTAPYLSYQINQCEDFWKQYKSFASFSSDFLLKSLGTIKFSLRHITKARIEFEQSRWRLPRNFARRYGLYLQDIHERLIQKRQQIVDSMLVRLKIASFYSNRISEKKQNVDDILFYMADKLAFLNITGKKTLTSLHPRADLTEDHYLKFYDAVKQYGKNDADKSRVDNFHWSKNLGFNASLLSRHQTQKSDHKHSGLALVETGKNNQRKIAIPLLLNGFMSYKRLSPDWYYWQERKIIAFWENRQSLLFKLHDLWNPNLDVNDKTALLKFEHYQNLIKRELKNIQNENIPFLAFSFKKMISAWESIINHLSLCAVNQLSKALNKSHQRKFVEDLKGNQLIPISVLKNGYFKYSDTFAEKLDVEYTVNPLQQEKQGKQKMPLLSLGKEKNKVSDNVHTKVHPEEQPGHQDDLFDDHHQGFFGYWQLK